MRLPFITAVFLLLGTLVLARPAPQAPRDCSYYGGHVISVCPDLAGLGALTPEEIAAWEQGLASGGL
ncbi:hypothetical protein BGY98DRAFT_1095394 [Russula aff. rugulosa BPL654]|nr:hypothetical protein BGY98DRAFT_1095394 [Russula aff. rugulosa BPL654]